jgi:hypothetical protein
VDSSGRLTLTRKHTRRLKTPETEALGIDCRRAPRGEHGQAIRAGVSQFLAALIGGTIPFVPPGHESVACPLLWPITRTLLSVLRWL